MRYYDLTLTPATGGKPFRQWSSYPGGTYDPQALDVEFDMPVLPHATPSGGQTITVYGVAQQDISQAQQFAGMNLSLRGGMKAGFPLVKPEQSGLLVQGQVFQSFGNWVGTEMTLDFVILPSTYTVDNPGNFVLDWKEGQTLADALNQTLSVAYPTMPISVHISNDLKNGFHCPSYYPTLNGLATFIAKFTKTVFNNQVQITIQSGKVVVFDETYKPGAVQLDFNDFVGQPTWIDVQTMQIKTVLRADLEIGSIITMPKGLQNAPGVITTTGTSLPSSIKYQSTFQNNFTISELRHIGSFRSADATAWCTVFNCVALT